MTKYKLDNSEVRRNLSKRWYNMISRCSDANDPYYGGRGVTVSNRWLDKETFINDCQTLRGYDKELLLTGKLFLDKDSIILGNTVYSPDTCCFLTQEESNSFKPNQMVAFTAISPNGEIFESRNQSEFAKEHSLLQTSISRCLRLGRGTHKGWVFRLKE